MNVKSVNALICFLMVLFEACKLADGLRNIQVRLDVPPSVPHRTSDDKNDPCKAGRLFSRDRKKNPLGNMSAFRLKVSPHQALTGIPF